MRRSLVPVLSLALLTALAVPAASAGGGQWKDLVQKLKTPAAGDAALSQGDIASGLKEALAQGTGNAIRSLGREGGFWNNAKVRIPLPGKLEQAAKLARQLGQGAKVDAFEHSLNQAAEKAVPEVAGIFSDAIKRMTLDDARRILAGGDHAATDFFRRTAGDALTARIHPLVSTATDEVGVTRKYKAFAGSGSGAALGSLLGKLDHSGSEAGANALDLDDYVTAKTLDGLFTMIGDEEAAIRANPAARTSALLKKVFGGGH